MSNGHSYSSIRIIALSLESAHQRITSSRQRLLESGSYSDYLVLAEFSGALNVLLIELARTLSSREEQP
jgi:hypothetical protein